MLRFCFLTVFLWGCTHSNPWHVDGITTGNRSFDSSRLRYSDHSPIVFEMVKLGTEIETFLSLTHFRLSSETPYVKVLFITQRETFEETIPLHEGQMKLRLPPEAASRLIQALQDGEKVRILLDDFEQTLDPSDFSSSFAKFQGGGGSLIQNLFRVPLQ